MNTADIERFIDRCAGYFPNATIALRTVKQTWARDNYLRAVDVVHAKAVLRKIESYTSFPTLGEVKQAFRRETGETESSPFCADCDYTGWVVVERGGKPVEVDIQGRAHTGVMPCHCRRDM